MKPRTIMKDFAFTPPVQKPRSSFDLSKRHLTTCESGYLIPVYTKQVYPGDTISLSCRHLSRLLSPMHTPCLDNLRFDLHCFYCDERVLFERFTEFMGERLVPAVPSTVTYPLITVGDPNGVPGTGNGYVGSHSIFDYIGIPPVTVGDAGILIKATPYRLYNAIYNWFYRDQDLTAMAPEYTDHGITAQEDLGEYPLRLRQKRKDYFTSCRPWPQKGPDVLLPLGSSAPVYGTGQSLAFVNALGNTADHSAISMATDLSTHNLGHAGVYADVGDDLTAVAGPNTFDAAGLITASQAATQRTAEPLFTSGLYADLSEAMASTINQFRYAMAIQMYLETDALYGTRFPEHLYGHWGITSHDVAYKPEYLGGGSDLMQFVPVTQTAPTSAGDGQGRQTGFGVGSGNLGGFTYTSESYGWIMCILSIVPDVSYSCGIARELLSADRFDFYTPELANLGEQPVYNVELFAGTDPIELLETFGYQEPWAHLRFDFNQLSGLMRGAGWLESGQTTLNVWHLSQVFARNAAPALNTEFLEHDPSIVDRICQVTTGPQFLLDLYFNVRAARILSAFPNRSRLGGL